MAQSKNFVFTWNNYPLEHKDVLSTYGAKYILYSHETAPSTGTPHLQGFICFPSKRRLSAIKKLLVGCWVDVAKGDIDQNADYISKLVEPVEIGTRPKSAGEGEAERWKLVKENAKAGKLDDIPEDIYIRYYGTLKRIAADHTPPLEPLSVLQNEWLWGPSGCGKSKSARDRFPGAYIKDPKEKWWDGYSGQETVIIDDFDKYQVSMGGEMKRWCDHYPFPAQIKGGTMFIRPTRVIVTSNYAPEEIWDDTNTLEPINRRFNVVHMGPVSAAFSHIFSRL